MLRQKSRRDGDDNTHAQARRDGLKRIDDAYIQCFFPVILVSTLVIVGWAVENVENKSIMLLHMGEMFRRIETEPPPLRTFHLWFLYQLMCFYLVTVVALKVNTIHWNLKSWMPGGSGVFVFFMPLVQVPALIARPVPLPTPEEFVPELWSFAYSDSSYWVYIFHFPVLLLIQLIVLDRDWFLNGRRSSH